ncbi:GNAT family N-acetyltransferase [Wenyingzhuangia aestuarii]|uniref:GNAT family N-acetyltransferase n=1 Tax=Wenyingzhuangia aestuarii TaxID=1647582 RepID=UPI00143B4517|nr:GNAT family protein [Wenyingzhuangia aestuarii]NJB84225.1 RimJ/RimL family protein N-acetyltransferase [Wenyingzhuangia aestuarii]
MIAIEKFNEKDFRRLINWSSNEETLTQFAGAIFTFPLTIEQLNEYVNNEQRLSFKVINLNNGNVIGHAEISPSEEENTVKICRILIGEKNQRGKGYGKEIIKQLLDKSFNELNKEKVELNVFDWNICAIKCYENIGFKINSSKTSISIVNGKKWKAINMQILKNNLKQNTKANTG